MPVLCCCSGARVPGVVSGAATATSAHLRCRSDSSLSNADSSNREALITFIHAAVTQRVRTARLR